jgi:RNA polymerase sigma-70 factor (ECF subfamily)
VRTLWQSLHADFARAINLFSQQQQFSRLRQKWSDLSHFTDPCSVIDFLHRRDADLETKDRILGALVIASQEDAQCDVATSMLWLALWPGLDAMYGRLWRHFKRAPAELVSEIASRFTQEIDRIDLGRVNRVPATIVANVERDIREGLRRRWQEESQRSDLPDLDQFHVLRPSRFHDGEVDGTVSALHRNLRDHIGADADIVMGVVVAGESQREIADRMGISYEAVRKRYQRSLRHLRDALKKN